MIYYSDMNSLIFPSSNLGRQQVAGLTWWLAPLEFFFQEQSYSSLHLGRSLAWDHVRGDIDDPCDAIADFCGVIADFSGVIAISEAIGGRRCGDADRCTTR